LRLDKSKKKNINFRQTAKNNLDKDFKALTNSALIEVQKALTDLGTYPIFDIIQQIIEKVSVVCCKVGGSRL